MHDIFFVVKKFLPEVKSRVWGRAGGRPGLAATTTTTRCGDKQPSLPGGGGGRAGGDPPPEYADTNVKFVPKINRELKSG